ncbi:glycerol-3-phosphate acyltransferase [Danaus plexippus plexippus]|uniref:Glycerol-3-phosphate acyltransferase n=1 Tax=Danaus plexippus plexippus TaxID=278856 RepID=A0A212F8X7_DANPL|nr:glycerol-3-phosphate acyltransferase [Danaus plexippus plexippus]
MSRSWEPTKTLHFEKPCSPQDLKNVVANSVYIDAIIEAESNESGVSKEKLKKEIWEYLDEMAMDKKMHVVRWMGVVFLKICFMMKIGVFVNESAVLKLKSTMGMNPVLFLPTHRSYADFCLMTYLCYHYDIDLPAVAAGMDFASMAVVGQSMRETGAFYIRRTLAGAPLYAAALRRYVRALVASYHAPVEFFLEGTRSRSNKSLPPKYGMLSMSLAPYFSRECTDVTLVPVNISYDRIMEQKLFAYEHLGVPKPKESTGGLIKSLHKLNDHYGNIYVNVGDPISLKEYLGDQDGLTKEMLKPTELQQITKEQMTRIQDVANYVITQQQKCTVVTISNLVAVVLMESLVRNEPLELAQVLVKLDWLIQVLRNLGATVFENDLKNNMERILVVHKNLIRIDRDNKLKLVSSALMDVSPDVQNKMKGHLLKAETMVNALPIIELQLYMNPVLHYLLPPALIYLIVRRRPVYREELLAEYRQIRRLLKYEFFYMEESEDRVFSSSVQFLVKGEALREGAGLLEATVPTALGDLLQSATLSSLHTMRICAEHMMKVVKCPESQALKRVQALVEESRAHPYCLSLDAISRCLRGLSDEGALIRSRGKQVTYEVVGNKMEECHRLVTSILPNINIECGTNNSVILNQDTPKSKL